MYFSGGCGRDVIIMRLYNEKTYLQCQFKRLVANYYNHYS